MWIDNDLLRIGYLPVVIIPLLLALFVTDLKLIQIVPDIIGWSFLLLSGNLMNDYIDMDRNLPLGKTGIATLSITFFIFGIWILRNAIFYALTFSIAGFFYNLKLKKIGYLELLLLGIVALMPYLSLTKNIDWNLLPIIVTLGAISEFIDKMLDEKNYKKISKQLNFVFFPLLIISIIFNVYLIIIDKFYIFLTPLIILLFGITFFLSKGYFKKPRLSMKISGVYTCLILLFYLIAVLAQTGKII